MSEGRAHNATAHKKHNASLRLHKTTGADSLTGDRLGRFNLTIMGHAACHRFMAKFGLPMLVVGGGGYKIKNVARCWAYETAVLLGA